LILAAQAPGELDPEAGEFNLFLFCFLVIGLVALAALAVIGIVVGIMVAVTGGAVVVSGAALCLELDSLGPGCFDWRRHLRGHWVDFHEALAPHLEAAPAVVATARLLEKFPGMRSQR
jgi:hypothetical protein